MLLFVQAWTHFQHIIPQDKDAFLQVIEATTRTAFIGTIYISSRERSSVVVMHSSSLKCETRKSRFGTSVWLPRKAVRFWLQSRQANAPRLACIAKVLRRLFTKPRKVVKPKPVKSPIVPRRQVKLAQRHKRAPPNGSDDAASHSLKGLWFAISRPCGSIRAPDPVLPIAAGEAGCFGFLRELTRSHAKSRLA